MTTIKDMDAILETYNSASDGFEDNPNVWKRETGAGDVDYPAQFSTRSQKMFDQMAKPITHKACTIFGSTHSVHSTIDKITIDPYTTAEEGVSWGYDPSYGWGLQDVAVFFQNTKRVRGYGIADKDVLAMKAEIFAGNAITTGSRQILWTATRKNKGFAVYGKGGGHLFSIDGWDDDMEHDGKKGFFLCRNSWTSMPEFFVAYDDIGKLYSMLVYSMDKDWVEVTKQQVDAQTIELAKDVGISNGNDLDAIATRDQAAVMIGRLMFGFDKGYDDLMALTQAKGIRNGTNGQLIRQHAMIMVGRYILQEHAAGVPDYKIIQILVRAGVTNGGDADKPCTRRQLILMITRAYKKIKGIA